MSATTAPAYVKSIKYNRDTKLFDCSLDGQWLFDTKTYGDGENRLDSLVFEILSAQYYREELASERRAAAEDAYYASLPPSVEGDPTDGPQIFTPEQAAVIAAEWPTQAEHLKVA
jgi:hypothetical protein